MTSAITVTVDSTFIRSREDGERRFEARVGNVETKAGGRQVFGGVAKAGTDIEGLVRKSLDAVGCTGDTALTAFTDGCRGLRGILADAGVLEPPILCWFHIAMASTSQTNWRWTGGGRSGARSREGGDRHRGRAIALADLEWKCEERGEKHRPYPRSDASFLGREGQPEIDRAGAKALDGGQSAWLVNYAERHGAELSVGTAITEGTANFLVNRRMNKCQQMRWPRRGADLLLQVRCAVYNGTLGSEFGQEFHPDNHSFPPTAVAA
jgi:hypothetical protein